jgi:formylglycine-generating enzyme required for sulfatase activity
LKKVFLSSTARDLTAFRESVYQAIEGLDDFHGVRMEEFGARDARADEFCRSRISECQLAVFLIGLCHGSTPEGTEESYTAQEYRVAGEAGLPRLVFLSGEHEYYPGFFREADELWQRQQTFRESVGKDRLGDKFDTPDELALKVVKAISNWVSTTQQKQVNTEPLSSSAGEIALRNAYLNRMTAHCGYLSLAGIDPAMAGKPDTKARLSLNAVYTALLTRSPKEPQRRPHTEEHLRLDREGRFLSALEQLDQHQHLVLLGEPGSGKSTFANFVALCLAGEALDIEEINLETLTAPLPNDEGEDTEEHQTWSHGELLPVLVVLRDFAATGLPERGKEATVAHLWTFIEQELENITIEEYAPYLKNELLNKGGLILLDGLDEVPEAERRREQVKQAVESFVQVYGNCRILVTSRTYAYQNQDWCLAGFDEARLAPFSDGQIRRFVTRWYDHTASLGRISKEDAAGRAQLLKHAIFSQPRLRELAERPLLLTLMASLHAWRGGNLPEKRERLYSDTVELLLDFWEQRRVKREATGHPILLEPSLAEWLKTDREPVRDVLETLAFEAHASQPELEGTADISEDTLVGRLLRLSENPEAKQARLIEYLRDRAGLLMPRGIGVYTFPHRSFQEYLAACHLTGEGFPDDVARLARTDPDRWREVALLAGAKAARGSAATIWQLADSLCFREPDDPQGGKADEWGAQLAARSLVESANLSRVSSANQLKLSRIQRWLIKLMDTTKLPTMERAQVGRNLAHLGDPRFDAEQGYLPKAPLLGLIEIPAGKFMMGSKKKQDKDTMDREFPQHSLELPNYYMARWPVTVAQFKAFVEDSGYEPRDSRCLNGLANHPVVDVTWQDAIAYCRWLDGRLHELAKARLSAKDINNAVEKRFWSAVLEGDIGVGLPSEAEWEKAARGTDGRIYPWGNEFDPDRVNCSNTGIGTRNAVGCFANGKSPYGCEEMGGNVWEWTRSLWGEAWLKPEFNYPYDPKDGRENLTAPGSVLRVLRGGAFLDDPYFVRGAVRRGAQA